MNACPSDGVLLQFLDGELKADDDAQVLMHIEDCAGCQQHLERLTAGRPISCERPSIETVQTDHDQTVDLHPTEIVDGKNEHPETARELRQAKSTGAWENGSGAADLAVPAPTAECSLTPVAAQVVSTNELIDAAASQADDLDRTANFSEADPKPAPVMRKAAPSDWPTIPGYDILERLGEGGMGVVYKARHRGLKRLVAVKMIRGGSQSRADQRKRFRTEAEAVARLRHPNILQIYDIGEAAGLPFVALELLDGGGLDDQAGSAFPSRQTRPPQLMVTLARAVHVARQSAIVHRDLKPTNVLYTSDGVPKITRLWPGQADRHHGRGALPRAARSWARLIYMALRAGARRFAQTSIRRPTFTRLRRCSTKCSRGVPPL